MSNFKFMSIFSGFWTPIKLLKMPSDLFYGEICLTKLKVCMGGTLRMLNFKILSTFLSSWSPL
jgi:hypothetical protein